MEYWKQELYHHGILGMKWGKRNGPPYPLSPGQHSESEKKAGWRKSLGGKKNPKLYRQAKKQAKIDRKARDRKIQDEYDRTEARIEAPYKRGQMLSNKDVARELAADDKARKAWAKSKEQYRTDLRIAKDKFGSDKAGSRWVSDDQSNLGIIADTAFTTLAVTAATGVVFLGMQYYKNGGFGNLANIPMSSIIDAAKNTVKANKESVIANAAVFSAIKLGHKHMNRSGFDNNSNAGSIRSGNKAGIKGTRQEARNYTNLYRKYERDLWNQQNTTGKESEKEIQKIEEQIVKKAEELAAKEYKDIYGKEPPSEIED